MDYRHLFLFISILLSVLASGSSTEVDARCKCVCAPTLLPNSTQPAARIYTRPFDDHEQCVCDNVVPEHVQEAVFRYCDRCECQWQRRNSTTIQVVVILIICIISLLFLYMLFLLCLDPLMTRRPKTYQEHHDEVSTPGSVTSLPGPSSQQAGGSNVISRVRQEVSKVKDEQQRWKGQVQEQRRHIYNEHTMLN